VSYPDGRVRRLTPRESEAIQGFPTDWSVPADLPSDPEKLDTLRYQAIGNAVSVPVAEWLARRVRKYIEDQAISSPSRREAVRVPVGAGGA